MRRGLTTRMVLASALLAVLVGGAFAVLLVALYQERSASDRSSESQGMLVAANRLERLVIDLETGERGFVITGEERFLEPWNAARLSLPAAAGQLAQLASPSQQGRVREIVDAVNFYLDDYSEPLITEARQNDPAARTVTSIEEGKRRVDQIRVEFDGLVGTEQALAAREEKRAQVATRRAIAAAVTGLASSVVLIVLFCAYLARAVALPVRRAATMAGRVAGGDLTVRIAETGTAEIGALERSFNTMAGSLQKSQGELEVLLDEQAALRRVATLVARGVSPTEVFAAVTGEVGRLFGATLTGLLRSESDGTVTAVAAHREASFSLGDRYEPASDEVTGLVLRTGLPARIDDDGSGSFPTRLRQRRLSSSVGAPVLVEGQLWGVMVAAWRERGAAPEEAETRMAQFTELVATAIANADSRAELSASRARIVAAGDQVRRKIERDLHDGIQQRLVSLGLELRAAESATPSGLVELKAQLSRTAGRVGAVVQELQEVSRGIHPAILSKGGIGPALKGLARRSTVPVELDIRIPGRLPEPTEVAAYYVVSEALTNSAKYANASFVSVCVEGDDVSVRVSVSDDGVGGAKPGVGSGLIGLRDRVEALGGKLNITSPPGSGTTLVATMPIGTATTPAH